VIDLNILKIAGAFVAGVAGIIGILGQTRTQDNNSHAVMDAELRHLGQSSVTMVGPIVRRGLLLIGISQIGQVPLLVIPKALNTPVASVATQQEIKPGFLCVSLPVP